MYSNATREELIKQIEDRRLIVIMRNIPESGIIEAVEAMYEGGIRFAELTFDQSGAVSDTETARVIGRLAERFAGRVTIGAGTVIDPAEVELAADAGAGFIISPNSDSSVIERTRELGLISIPGAMTVSEITADYRCGADFVKVFPSSLLGTAFFKAVRAPLPMIRLLAVNGIGLSDIPAYLDAGAAGFGIGGAIVNHDRVVGGRFDEVRENAALYAAACGK